ncbi:MAG: MOSC domain-containing protein [Bryobacteraceae bacterium]|nr:MOSC domain-containing protein [Bryobacteraceae bacterium]MCX7605271.1 MOSC domain-containing protein [Bryobacteraceae bacterium]
MRGVIEAVCISPGGLPKLPVAQALCSAAGLGGDGHHHPQIHGGPEKALLLIAVESLERLRGEGFPVASGSLGENLTTRGVDFRLLTVGMRFRAGEALIELTKLRRPCRQLEPLNAGRTGAIQRRLEEEPHMGGWYARVLLGGWIRRGDIIELTETAV